MLTDVFARRGHVCSGWSGLRRNKKRPEELMVKAESDLGNLGWANPVVCMEGGKASVVFKNTRVGDDNYGQYLVDQLEMG